MKKILITRRLIKESEEKASKLFEANFNANDELYSQKKIIEMSQGYDGILSSLTEKLDAETINQLPESVKIISNFAVGFGNINLEAAKNKGIVTGKLFEYIRSMSKIIMIGPLDSDAAGIINNTSSGKCFDYDNSTDIVQYLESSKYPKTINFEKYNRKNLTLELVEILEKMIDDYNK